MVPWPPRLWIVLSRWIFLKESTLYPSLLWNILWLVSTEYKDQEKRRLDWEPSINLSYLYPFFPSITIWIPTLSNNRYYYLSICSYTVVIQVSCSIRRKIEYMLINSLNRMVKFLNLIFLALGATGVSGRYCIGSAIECYYGDGSRCASNNCPSNGCICPTTKGSSNNALTFEKCITGAIYSHRSKCPQPVDQW